MGGVRIFILVSTARDFFRRADAILQNMERTQGQSLVIALTLGIAIVAFSAHVAFAQLSATACPAGSVPITSAADRAAAHAAGIPDSSNCWQKQDVNVGADAGQAKQYLRSKLCSATGNNYGGMGPDGTVQGLDTKFAECAAAFFKAAETQGIPVCLREGKRSVEKQEQYAAEYRAGGGIACTKGAGCEHPRGIAIDVNTTNDTLYSKLHALAPSFGLTFYLGFKDKVHFVPQKAGCSAGGTAPNAGSGTTGGSFPTGGTNANGNLPASYYDYPQYAPTAAAASPFSTALNALTPLLNNQQTQPTQPAYTAPTTLPTNYDSTPLPTATSSIFTVPPPYTYPIATTTSGTQNGPSAYDQIQLYSGTNTTGTSLGTQTSTSAPTQLNGDLYDIGTTSTGGSNVGEDLGVMDTLAENSVAVNPIHVTETFTHDEPTVVAPGTSTNSSAVLNKSLVVALLTTLRDLLLSFVNILKNRPSVGFQAPWQVPSNTPVYH